MSITLPLPNGLHETIVESETPSPRPSPRPSLRPSPVTADVESHNTSRSDKGNSTPQSRRPNIQKDASIVFTGPRNNGKSSLAVLAGLLLRRRVLDADEYTRLAKTTPMPEPALKRKFGHDDQPPKDRRLKWTKALLSRYSKGFVIACGPILATRACRDFTEDYAKTHPIIYVRSCSSNSDENVGAEYRGFGQGKELLGWMQELLAVCHTLSNYDFFNLPERWKDDVGQSSGEKRLIGVLPHRDLSKRRTQALQRAQASLARFLASALGYEASSLSHTVFPTLHPRLPQNRLYSNLLRVRLSNKDLDVFQLPTGADAVEIVNDVWESSGQGSCHLEQLTRLVAEIRRYLQTPVIYHVEHESGKSSQGDRENYIAMLYQGLRLAPEYLTVNLRMEDNVLSNICRDSDKTAIVGHYENMDEGEGFWTSSAPRTCYQRALRMGCSVVRIVKKGQSVDEDYHCLSFAAKVASAPGAIPVIAYNIGKMGHLSRVCNPILSPVVDCGKDTHAYDLTIQTRWATLFSLHILDPLHFYVFGSSVNHSMSPAMHNMAFATLGMPHTYKSKETAVLEDLPALWNDTNFGGASISLPFKKDILRYVSHRSPSVEMIGAANTIIPIREKAPSSQDFRSKEFRHKAGPFLGLYADNTDWMGICACLSRSISPANTINRETVGLVVGAGGMARAAVYALLYLGVRNICIYNRTPSRAQTLATHFRQVFVDFASSKSQNADSATGLRMTVLESLDDEWPKDWKQPSIVICAIKAHDQQNSSSAPFVMPSLWMKSPTGGVVVEMTFYTPETHIMKQFREQKPPGWTLVDPIEVFHTQACTQLEIFIGCRAPAKVMRDALLHDYAEKMKQGVFHHD